MLSCLHRGLAIVRPLLVFTAAATGDGKPELCHRIRVKKNDQREVETAL